MTKAVIATDDDTTAPTKVMKYRATIGRSEFETKTAKVRLFLKQGHRVRVTVLYRGREVHHPELGVALCDRVAQLNRHLAEVEALPELRDDRTLTMVLAPLPGAASP
jgi:translation initiation factor IF-3